MAACFTLLRNTDVANWIGLDGGYMTPPRLHTTRAERGLVGDALPHTGPITMGGSNAPSNVQVTRDVPDRFRHIVNPL